jgi:hypothetical protein
MVVLIGRGGNILPVLACRRLEQIPIAEPPTASSRKACHDLGIIGTSAQTVKRCAGPKNRDCAM